MNSLMKNSSKIVYIIGLISSVLAFSNDAYTKELSSIINKIANEYDPTASYYDPDYMLGASIRSINFIIKQNNIAKNSPLGIKNKNIEIVALEIKSAIIKLIETIKDADLIKEEITKNTILDQLYSIHTNLYKLETKLTNAISKKQLLPLSKVQKDLVALLELLVNKNIRITDRMIINVKNIK